MRVEGCTQGLRLCEAPPMLSSEVVEPTAAA